MTARDFAFVYPQVTFADEPELGPFVIVGHPARHGVEADLHMAQGSARR